MSAWSSAGCSAPHELEGLAYDERFGDATTMDVYLPDDSGGPRPAILMIHGGAWRFGSKEAYRDAAARMARSGF